MSEWPTSLCVVVGTVMASPASMWIGWGPELVQIYNDAFVDANDRTPESLGRPASETWADAWQLIAPEIESVRDGGPAVHREDRRISCRRGEVVEDLYWTYSYSPIPDASARHGVGGVLCFAAETTARVRTALALRETEERQAFLLRLSDALRPISDPVVIQATATRLLGEQLAANRVCYVEVSETESVVHQDYVSGVPSIAGRWRNADFGKVMEDALRTGRTNVVSDIGVLPGLSDVERASYAAIHVAAQIVVTLIKDGRWVANFGVQSASPRAWTKLEVQLAEETAERTWSAMERARAEVALRESEERYRSLFETMGQGYTLVEIVRDQNDVPVDLLLLELNPAYERLLGVSAEVARGKRVYADVLPQLDRWWLDTYDRIVRAGQPERVQYTYLDRWYEAWIYPRSAIQFVGLFEEITELKRAEQLRRESDERQSFVLELSDRYRASPGEDAVGRTCVHALAAHFGAQRCYITELSSETNRGLVGPEYYEPGLVPIAGEHRYSDYPNAIRDLKNGEPFVTSHVDHDTRLSETDKASIGGGLGLQAMISAPLYAGDGNAMWALNVGTAAPRTWSDHDVRLVQDVVERTWAAIERARAHRVAADEADRLIAARTSERDALRRQLARAEEAERQRLSRELHDQLGQELTAFRLGLEDAARLAAENNRGRRSTDTPLFARIEQLKALANSLMRGARYIALELRPPELDDVGLASALETYALEWAGRYGIAAEVTVIPWTDRETIKSVPKDVASTLYRIAQEGLTNIAKHAQATQVSIVIDQRESEARLIIEDNGRGFDVAATRMRAQQERRLGLAGMAERAVLIGGTIDIESSQNGGTTLFVRLPT